MGLKENLNNLIKVLIFKTLLSLSLKQNYLINSSKRALRSHLAKPK